jgi:WD40 repeat protein
LSHSDSYSVLNVAFSADGELLASAGDDCRVRLWNVSTGEESVSLKPGCGVNAAVGPDGRTLAALDGHRVKMFDMATGQASKNLSGTNFKARLALCPDGRSLVSMNWRNGLVTLWDVATSQAQPMGVQQGWGAALVVSPDGALAASAVVGGTEVKLWDLADKRELRTFTHIGPVNSLAFSPDRQMLAAATKDKVIKVWSTADGKERKTLLGGRVAFSPEGPLAAAGGDTITLYDPISWQELRTLHRPAAAPSEPFSLAFNPSGRLVATSNDDGKVVVWDLNDAKAAPRSFWVCRPRQSSGEIAFTPEGRYLVSANANGTTSLLRLTPTPEK